MIHRLFIYGSLLHDCHNHIRLLGAAPVGPARTAARYRLLDLVDYPGLAEHGGTAVMGELYDVDDKLLAALDLFEGVP
jgi:gamma-glutamylaminecyclotransferase